MRKKTTLSFFLMAAMLLTACGSAGPATSNSSSDTENTSEYSTDTKSASTEAVENNAETTFTDSEQEGKIELTGMTWGSTTTIQNYTDSFFQDNPDLAEKYSITWVSGGEGDADVAQQVRLALSSDEPIADFVQLNYTQVPEFSIDGVLIDIGDAIEPYKSDISEGALNLMQYNGNTIAFPFEMKPRIWFYRQDMFDEAGIDVTQIKTTDDFIEAGKKVQEIYPDSYVWNLGSQIQGYDYFLILSGNGAKFTDDDGNYILDSDPGTRNMLEDLKKIHDAGIAMDVSDWTPDWENAIANNSICSILTASWMGQSSLLPTYAEGQKGKWACAQWPEIGGSTGGSDGGGSVFVIPQFSSHVDEAKELLAAMTLSKAGTLAIWKQIASYPINREAAKDESVTEPNEFFGTSLAEAEKTAIDSFSVFNYSPKAAAEQDIIYPYFQKAIDGDMTIDDALASAQSDLESQIGNALQ